MHDELVRGVFPADTAVAWASMSDTPDALLPGEEVFVAKAVAKRRHEFALGRSCARRALTAFGIEPQPLLVGSMREPLWPSGIVGSITHDRALCVAVVARSSAYAGIGVDVEPDEPLDESVAARIWSADEANAARASEVVPLASAAKLVFAAKEAVYKCQFPITGEYVGFHGVSVELAAHAALETSSRHGTFTATFTAPVGPLPSGFRLNGVWWRADGELLAAVWRAHS
jgi:4'-phosphopantetheinyl transferase EntD